MSVTIEVPIPDDLLPVLDRKARSAGLQREQYVSEVISRALHGEPTLNEILAGFREQVASSGISTHELDDLFEAARNEAAAQKNS